MSQEQIPQIKTPLTAESEPSAPLNMEAKTSFGAPLVPEEDLERMRAQIANTFKESTLLSGKNNEWEPEAGMGEQGFIAAKIAFVLVKWGVEHPILAGRGLFEAFKK